MDKVTGMFPWQPVTDFLPPATSWEVHSGGHRQKWNPAGNEFIYGYYFLRNKIGYWKFYGPNLCVLLCLCIMLLWKIKQFVAEFYFQLVHSITYPPLPKRPSYRSRGPNVHVRHCVVGEVEGMARDGRRGRWGRGAQAILLLQYAAIIHIKTGP